MTQPPKPTQSSVLSPQRSLPPAQHWYSLTVWCEAGAAVEAAQYGLLEAGAAGTEERAAEGGLVEVIAYFAALPERERVREALGEALRLYSLPSAALREMRLAEVAAHDWLAEWKANWRPVEAGARFLIAPPWTELDGRGAGERLIIRIEPGMAFGTGTHETTRLCLAAIEKHYAGESFLDVGTGTGILAIAAAKLFPGARVEACDTDAEAIGIAAENARLNGVAESIRFRVGSVDTTTPSAACVCANLTADVILPLLPVLLGLSCERTILSGILVAQVKTIEARLAEMSVFDHEVITDGEWAALII